MAETQKPIAVELTAFRTYEYVNVSKVNLFQRILGKKPETTYEYQAEFFAPKKNYEGVFLINDLVIIANREFLITDRRQGKHPIACFKAATVKAGEKLEVRNPQRMTLLGSMFSEDIKNIYSNSK